MLDQLKLEDVLFLDIETVPQYATHEEVPEATRKLWERKAGYLKREADDTSESLYCRAGIYAEFGKIICISTGFIHGDGFRIKSFFGNNEPKLLEDFGEMLNRHYSKPHHLLCGHNAKEFDFPYIARRMLINGLELPKILKLYGKKPWEVQHLDTMDLWRFGDYKSYTSLSLLTNIFGIPSPKDDLDGSMVGDTYWKDKDLPRIVNYCQKDTLAVAQLLLRFMGRPLIRPECVEVF
jgi:DNA polymerase elongation subunit (family B)